MINIMIYREFKMVIFHSNVDKKHVPSKPRVRPHEKTTHPNNMIYMIYLSPEDAWKDRLYAVILTLSFQDLGF